MKYLLNKATFLCEMYSHTSGRQAEKLHSKNIFIEKSIQYEPMQHSYIYIL